MKRTTKTRTHLAALRRKAQRVAASLERASRGDRVTPAALRRLVVVSDQVLMVCGELRGYAANFEHFDRVERGA